MSLETPSFSSSFSCKLCLKEGQCRQSRRYRHVASSSSFVIILVLSIFFLPLRQSNKNGSSRYPDYLLHVRGFSTTTSFSSSALSRRDSSTKQRYRTLFNRQEDPSTGTGHSFTVRSRHWYSSTTRLYSTSSVVPPLPPPLPPSDQEDDHVASAAVVAAVVTTKEDVNNTDNSKKTKTTEHEKKKNVGERVIKLCIDYGTRLWRETSDIQRQEVSKERAIQSIEKVKNLVDDKGLGGAHWDIDQHFVHHDDEEEDESMVKAKKDMALACESMLRILKRDDSDNSDATAAAVIREEISVAPVIPKTAAAVVLLEKEGETNTNGKTIHLQKSDDLEQQRKSVAETETEMALTTLGSATARENNSIQDVSNSSVRSSTDDDSNDTMALTTKANAISSPPKKKKKKKQRRSILFGATMGALTAMWVFSGNFIFTSLFTIVTVLGQLEYYRMVMSTGVYPARRISVLGACATFISALVAPRIHQLCLPTFATWAMIWFLTMRRSASTISEIATTFTGMFYLGYMPSFWVRTRVIQYPNDPTRLKPLAETIFQWIRTKLLLYLPNINNKWIPKTIENYLPITTGATFIFWSWLCIAFSDVGGYFVGRAFGKNKLGVISPAAGVTSPNKTVEGVIGGCGVSMILATIGSYVQHWPHWYITGPIHGLMLGILGLIGDLTASMLKRDAGIKDFGDLIPEHGGIMDRVDSYIFSAPYSFLVLTEILPALR